MLVLGIETSCDETACAVVKEGRTILSNVVASSLEEHKPYGGVVPEIACRSHVESMAPVLEEALKRAGISYGDIQLIAATHGPGLPGSLLVGLSTAKALSFARRIPFIGVDHLQAHLYAGFMGEQVPSFPLVGMVISGGHTSLYWMEDVHRVKPLAETEDDACGEAFDKVAKILGLGYPGGPVVEKVAAKGNPKRFSFPPPRLNEKSLDFSFSGIKTAVLYKVKELKEQQATSNKRQGTSDKRQGSCTLPATVIADICASFQKVVIETVVHHAIEACRRYEASTLVVGGGVIANKTLRKEFQKRCREEGLQLFFPPRGLSLDNAAMVAGLGYALYERGVRSS